jgi:hypothetical protein
VLTGGPARGGNVPRVAGRIAVVTVLALLAIAAPAAGQGKIFDDFRSDGQIDPCDYTPQELKQGLDSLPPDVLQYAPDLADQLRRGATCAAPAPQPEPQTAAPPPAAAPPTDPPAPPPVPEPPAPDPAPLPRIVGAAPAVAVAPPRDEGEPAWPWLLVGAAGALALLARFAPLRGSRRLVAGLRTGR